ncbi:MAG: alpha/beta hydrolase family protein [Ardenticatenaceae bacterium]
MNRIHVIHTDEYFCYRPASDEPLPTVIHVPGFNEDARSHASFALRMAEAGIQCVALNPPWENTPQLNNPSPAILFGLFAKADKLLKRVLARLREENKSDVDWLALTGFSMGGMFVARTLAQGEAHAFRAAAMVLSTGDWSFLPRITLNAFPDLKAVIQPDTVAMVEQLLRTQSPIATPERFPPTPLLLINADEDPRLPLAVAEGFYEALRPAYERQGVADALQFHIHKGKRHEFRRAMQRQVRDWLVERRG